MVYWERIKHLYQRREEDDADPVRGRPGEGLSFNGRRQSQDRRVREDLLTMALKRDAVDGRLLPAAVHRAGGCRHPGGPGPRRPGGRGAGCACWSSRTRRRPWSGRDRLVLYRWGRRYPADRRLDLPPKRAGGWRDGQSSPAAPNDMITKEIYIK